MISDREIPRSRPSSACGPVVEAGALPFAAVVLVGCMLSAIIFYSSSLSAPQFRWRLFRACR